MPAHVSSLLSAEPHASAVPSLRFLASKLPPAELLAIATLPWVGAARFSASARGSISIAPACRWLLLPQLSVINSRTAIDPRASALTSSLRGDGGRFISRSSFQTDRLFSGSRLPVGISALRNGP